jgi:hypothetical protein
MERTSECKKKSPQNAGFTQHDTTSLHSEQQVSMEVTGPIGDTAQSTRYICE